MRASFPPGGGGGRAGSGAGAGERKTPIPSPPPRGARGLAAHARGPAPNSPSERGRPPAAGAASRGGTERTQGRGGGASRAAEAAVGSVERGARGLSRVRATGGPLRLGPGRGSVPAAPHARRGMRESFAPARGQDVGAGQRLGGGGGVGSSELVAAAGAPASAERAEWATCCATFAKGKIKILQVVAQLQVSPRSHEQRGRDTATFPGLEATASSAEVGRRGLPAGGSEERDARGGTQRGGWLRRLRRPCPRRVRPESPVASDRGAEDQTQ